MSDDTALAHPEVIPPEPVEPEAANPLAAFGLGGLDLGAMLGSMGVELPDPDDATVTDVYDEVAELVARVDWIAHALLAVAESVPAKWRPELPAYPPPVPEG